MNWWESYQLKRINYTGLSANGQMSDYDGQQQTGQAFATELHQHRVWTCNRMAHIYRVERATSGRLFCECGYVWYV